LQKALYTYPELVPLILGFYRDRFDIDFDVKAFIFAQSYDIPLKFAPNYYLDIPLRFAPNYDLDIPLRFAPNYD